MRSGSASFADLLHPFICVPHEPWVGLVELCVEEDEKDGEKPMTREAFARFNFTVVPDFDVAEIRNDIFLRVPAERAELPPLVREPRSTLPRRIPHFGSHTVA